MGKKLPTLEPNILKHLQKKKKKKKGTLQKEMDLCSLSILDFHCSVRAFLPPVLCCAALSVTRTKMFCRNLELFKSWKKKKKLGFFHKWLYHVEKANTSAHCWSHKTSESAAGWGPQSCRLTRYETL